ncbi:MAG: FtsB family cell division protein [Bryobacteraceae bacterium]
MKSSVLRAGYGIAIVVAVIYAVYTLRGPNGIAAYVEKRQQIKELEERVTGLTRENQLQRDRMDRLRNSQSEQDLRIREHLRKVKPNEKVYIVDP